MYCCAEASHPWGASTWWLAQLHHSLVHDFICCSACIDQRRRQETKANIHWCLVTVIVEEDQIYTYFLTRSIYLTLLTRLEVTYRPQKNKLSSKYNLQFPFYNYWLDTINCLNMHVCKYALMQRLDSNIEWKSLNNTYLNFIKLLFFFK